MRRRMLNLVLALAAMPIAACSSARSPPATPEEACARQADDAPAVRDALGKAAGNLDWQWQHGGEIRQARQDAITDCLRSRGLAPIGGVERPR